MARISARHLWSAAALIVATARASAPEVSKNVRVYRADEGVSVAVDRVLPEKAARAVIGVTGSDSPLEAARPARTRH